MEFKDQRYLLSDIELQKQETGSRSLAQILEEQEQQLVRNQINDFRKDLYVKEGAVEKIRPEKSRRAIQVIDDPVIHIDCPEPDSFPPVLPTELERREKRHINR